MENLWLDGVATLPLSTLRPTISVFVQSRNSQTGSNSSESTNYIRDSSTTNVVQSFHLQPEISEV